MKRGVVTVWLLLGSLAGSVLAFQPQGGQDDFVPVGAVAKADTLPAGPMLIAAYAFVWVAVMVYVWYLWRRLQKVERDLADLERRAQGR